MSLNLASILRCSAAKYPTNPAMTIGDKTLNYATLDAYARAFAGGLQGLGIKPGQHVALMLPNVPHFTMAYYGSHYAAAPVVPLNVLLTADEVHYHLDDSDAVVLVAWEGFYEAAHAAFLRSEGCKHLIVVKADPSDLTADAGVTNFTALLGSATPVTELPATMPDDTAVVLYTSGTTGRPKGAELTHFNLYYNGEYAGSRLMPLTAETVGLVALPLFHSFGQTVLQNAVLRVGGHLILMPRFEPTAAFELLVKHEISLFAGVPTMYFALLHHPKAGDYDLSSLQFCVSGGSAMPVEVMKAFDARYGVSILEGYGLSETSPVASFNVLDRPKKAGTIGLPIEGVEFRLIDGDGKRVTESDTAGEIQIKGHNVMKGYYKRPEVNAETIVDGWFATGDIGMVDDEGYYRIVDRKKDMIIRGGYNVYPREIEEVLYGHPAIGEAAVIGIAHPSHGEEVKAVVALKAGAEATTAELAAYCKERLAAYKYPRVFEIIAELPKGATGKILKRELR
ncbi:MAG: long-chain fatty acid--CoA ligase [Myxococcales bacterium]|nr:long-chain fatty acid--CoA ligase [Myxococcales bacterium]